MTKLIKEPVRYKRYLVKAVESMPFEGDYDKGIIFTTDDREELIAYLAEMPSDYDMDEISVFDCDERMFITEEFRIGFVKRKPVVYTKEQEERAKMWQPVVENFFRNPLVSDKLKRK